MGENKTAPGTGGGTGFALCAGRKTGWDTSYSKTVAGLTKGGLLRHLAAGLVTVAVTQAMALLLLPAVTAPAYAADASTLESKIEKWDHGGDGELTAVASDNIVIVTGEITDANNTLRM